MKKIKTKVWLFSLLACLLAMVLTGCGSPEGVEKAAGQEEIKVYPLGMEATLDSEDKIEEGPAALYTTGAENSESGNSIYHFTGIVEKHVAREDSYADLPYFVVKTARGQVCVYDPTPRMLESDATDGTQVDEDKVRFYFGFPPVGERVRVYGSYLGKGFETDGAAILYGGAEYMARVMILSSTLGGTPNNEATAQAGEPEKTATKYSEGMYKVGTELPAGEYLLQPTRGQGYLEISSDSSGTFDSIVTNENFSGQYYITVAEGQYLTLKRCAMVAVKDIEPTQAQDGFLPEGMYKVGFDLPAGEYKLAADSGSTAYMAVLSDSKGVFESIVTNDNFSGEKYLTVSEGQYLNIKRGRILIP